MKKIIILSFLAMASFSDLFAQNNFTEKDRELLIKTNLRLEEMQRQMDMRFDLMQRQMDVRFEQMDKRFEQVDKRFEQIDKRIEQVDKRIDLLSQFMVGILATFTALCVAMFGLMIWDRKTTTKPFEEKIKNLDVQVNELANNKETLKKVVQSLQQLAKNNTQLAEILKNANLL
jgi:septal ring factor EnvC (AmiA/AmiB activator)